MAASLKNMKVVKQGNDVVITLPGFAEHLNTTAGRKRTQKSVCIGFGATDVTGVAVDRGDKKLVAPVFSVTCYVPKKRFTETAWEAIPLKGTDDEQTSEFAAE